MSASAAGRARPMISSRRVQLYFGVVIAALVAAALYTHGMIERRESSLDNASGVSISDTAGQTVVAFQGLNEALLKFERSRAPLDLAESKLRFSILQSRALALGSDRFSPPQARVVADLQGLMHQTALVLANADTSLDVEPILLSLEPLEPQILDLAAEADRLDAAQASRRRQVLESLHSQMSALTFGLIICGLCLVGALIFHNRLLRRAHRELSQTTRDLKQAADDLAAANRAVASANSELTRQNMQLSEKESLLQSQNILFDAALNNMSQGLCMFDDALRPIVFNSQFEELFQIGSTLRKEVDGPAFPRLPLHDYLPDLAAEIERNVRSNQAAAFEAERPDGRVIAVVVQPMAAGGWLATFEDVTESAGAPRPASPTWRAMTG